MKKAVAILFLASVLFCGGCSTTSGDLSDSGNKTEPSLSYKSGTESKDTSSGIAAYEGKTLEFGEATVENGEIRINVTFTNNTAEPIHAMSAFAVKAYQDDAEIDNVNDLDNGKLGKPLIQEVKNGKTSSGVYSFKLKSKSDVEVWVCTPTASAEVLTKKTYSVNQ